MTDEPAEHAGRTEAGGDAAVPADLHGDQTSPGGGAGTQRPGQAAKLHARRQFDGWAQSYDRSVVQHLLFEPAYRMFMEELYRWRRDIPTALELLDIGSGTGTWTARVAGSGLPVRRIVGLDYSAKMGKVALTKAKEVGEGAPEFVNADAEHLPFPDDTFDMLTCSHSLHHYPHQAETVREMHRVLRSGGRLMIIDGFRDNAIGWVLYDVLITRGESAHEVKVHHASWKTMRAYFVEAGFRDIRQRKTSIWAPIFLTVGVA